MERVQGSVTPEQGVTMGFAVYPEDSTDVQKLLSIAVA